MSSIVLASLSWRAPDGTSIIKDLDLTFGPKRTGLVGRNGTGKTTLLRLIAGELTPASGKISHPGRVSFLPQNPEQRADSTVAELFGVQDELAMLALAECGEANADQLADIDWTLAPRLRAALTSLGLDVPLETPLHQLSGGQRTRASLAALMFHDPDVLLLDEPTNHLDRAGRGQVIESLRAWRGVVIVASHDRNLLREMDAIVELTTLGARTYGGNFDVYRDLKASELSQAESDLEKAERALAQTRSRAQLAAERKARTDRKGRQLRISRSQPKIILDAAKERSEQSGGANARLRAQRMEDAEAGVEAARDAVEILQPLIMEIPPSGLTATRDVLKVEGLSFSYRPGKPILNDISFDIRGPERIAIEGPNGSGKSTLLACINGDLVADAGTVALQVPAALLNQDMSLLDPHETVRDALERLDPQAGENQRRATLARFLFRGDDALQTIGTLSGGQRLRAGLACTLGHSQPKQLLLLDEPSNHLDIDAVETLETALNAYDGAILVVSHDTDFLERIGVARRLEL